MSALIIVPLAYQSSATSEMQRVIKWRIYNLLKLKGKNKCVAKMTIHLLKNDRF